MLLTALLNNFNIFFLLYTDPGSGALLLQLLMASLLGGLFYIRTIKDKIFRMLSSKKLKQNEKLDSYLPEKSSNT